MHFLSHYEIVLMRSLLNSKCVCACSVVSPTLCSPTDYSLPSSSVHGIFQARILEWVAIPLSRVSSAGILPMSLVSSALACRFFTSWATREAPSVKEQSLIPTPGVVTAFTNRAMTEMTDFPAFIINAMHLPPASIGTLSLAKDDHQLRSLPFQGPLCWSIPWTWPSSQVTASIWLSYLVQPQPFRWWQIRPTSQCNLGRPQTRSIQCNPSWSSVPQGEEQNKNVVSLQQVLGLFVTQQQHQNSLTTSWSNRARISLQACLPGSGDQLFLASFWIFLLILVSSTDSSSDHILDKCLTYFLDRCLLTSVSLLLHSKFTRHNGYNVSLSTTFKT